jgi:hypothetical protein
MVLLYKNKTNKKNNSRPEMKRINCVPSESMQTPPASLTINVPAAEIN